MAKAQKSNREVRKPKAATVKGNKKPDGSVEGVIAAGKQTWGKSVKK